MRDPDICQGKTMREETEASLAMLCIAVSLAIVVATLIGLLILS